MQIVSFHIERVRIPLNFRFAQANNATASSDSTILKLQTGNGVIGLGECCPRTYVTGEDFHSVQSDLQHIEQLVKKWTCRDVEDIKKLVLNTLPGMVGSNTICGIESALLDAWSKAQKRPVSELLNCKTPQPFQYSGVLPMRSLDKFPALVERLKYFNFHSLKMKVGTDLQDSLKKVQIIRDLYHPNTRIRVDANACWDLETARKQIPEFIKAGVHQFEQMLPQGQEDSLAKITKEFGEEALISVDESFTSPASTLLLLQQKACNHFNIKISKHGGIFHSLRLYQLIKDHGYQAQLGAHFGETSLLTRAGMLFASLAGPLTDMEGAYGEHLLEKDYIQPSLSIDQKGQMYLEALENELV